MGSDYLFISRDTNKSISPTAHPYGQNPNQEGHAKRNIHKQRAAESPGFGLDFFVFLYRQIDYRLSVGCNIRSFAGFVNAHDADKKLYRLLTTDR